MSKPVIRTENVAQCPLCGNEERRILYAGLSDRWFGASGVDLSRVLPVWACVFGPQAKARSYRESLCQLLYALDPACGKASPVRQHQQAIEDGYLGKRWRYDSGLRKWQTTRAPLHYLLPEQRVELDAGVMYLKARPGARLLDVGCGSGELIELMRKLGWQAKDVDFDAQAVRIARAWFKGSRRHVRAARLLKASLDAITMSHVIEHLHDPLRWLRECKRVLKLGGCLVIVTPNLASLGHSYCKRAWVTLDPPRHLQLFTLSPLRWLAAKSGLRELEASTTLRDTHWLSVASWSIKTGRFIESSRQLPAVSVWSSEFQLAESAILKVKSDVDEEIAIVLQK